LLPQLEPFAESTSLHKAYIASKGASELCQKDWDSFGTQIKLSVNEQAYLQLVAIDGVSNEHSTAEETKDVNESDAARFVDLWTSLIAIGTMGKLALAICCMPVLNSLGKRQLAADLSYFHNVLKALGIEPHFVLSHLESILGDSKAIKDDSLIEGSTTPGDSSAVDTQKSILSKLDKCMKMKMGVVADSVDNFHSTLQR